METLDSVLDALPCRKRRLGLPLVCGKALGRENRHLLLMANNTYKFLQVLPRIPRRLVMYHAKKGGRPPGKFQSYRTIGLNTLEISVTEGLWMSVNAETLWVHAGDEQTGRMDPLIPSKSTLDGTRMRQELF